MPARMRPHYTGSYQRRARLVRAAAKRNPLTRCWRCTRLLQEHPPHRNGRPPFWTAGHVITGKVDGELRPEASTCNLSHGASWGNARRTKGSKSRARRQPAVLLNGSRSW